MSDTASRDADELLLSWLRERDARCPACGYNLRNLTESRCPECKEPLTLRVTIEDRPLKWFLLTVAPGFFSGIAGTLFIIPIVRFGPPPVFITLTAIFGLASGGVAIALCGFRRRFVRQARSRQFVWAFAVWGIHVTMFGWFVFMTS